MRWGWLAVMVVVAVGCKAVPTAADFEFPDGDAGVGAEDVAFGGDAVDVPGGTDAVDVADQIDTEDATDASVDVDALPFDVADIVDATVGQDAAVDTPSGTDAKSDADVPVNPCLGKNCSDGVPCTIDSCDLIGGCVHTPDNTKCDDSQLCTADTCSTTGCQHVNSAAACDDGDSCTADTCVIGAGCVHTPDNTQCDDGEVCTSDLCQAGACSHLANGLGCNDNSACTYSDQCVGGACVGVSSCDDGNACTNDSCASDACQHVNNTAGCDDGNNCTTADACVAGVCKGSGPACGNGTCDCGESMASCAADCASAGMVLIPAGTFWMGCNAAKDANCAADEKPQHKVTLSAYYMDVTETTVAQYKACVDAGVCTVPSSQSPTTTYATYPGFPNSPVNFVNWTQAQNFCKWRGADFDLPTEAQWEMAARGSCDKNGSTAGDAGCATAMRTYPWGETTPTCAYAVMNDGTKFGCGTNATWAVGSKTAGDSPYGLHDMAGNVWEWNRDWYATYSAGAVTDPVGPGSASLRVTRGGSFNYLSSALRAGTRDSHIPSGAGGDFGLRCTRAIPPANLCASITCPAIACATNTCDATTGQCVATPKADTTPCDDGNACTTGDACSAGVCKGTAPVCGNGTCDCGESKTSCIADCGSAPAGMVLIPAGTFWMGCNAAKDSQCAADESPQHKVTLSAYYIDQNEATGNAWLACVNAGACTAPDSACGGASLGSINWDKSAGMPALGRGQHPVNCVNWTQARAYCQSRGAGFDLPTEAQWEMAARGNCEQNGSTAGAPTCAAAMRTYPWGPQSPTCDVAILAIGGLECTGQSTAAVGIKSGGASPFGIQDTVGNVSEWVRDAYTGYGAAAVADPYVAATGSEARSLRGSNYAAGLFWAVNRSSDRLSGTPGWLGSTVGLRCARPVDLCAGVTCPAVACASNTCDPGTGKCVATPKADATPCDDGNACTGGDVCTSGTCAGTVNCDDGNACTNDSCVSLACQHVNNAAGCDDGNACTTNDACSAGVCKGTAPVCGNGTCDCGESNATCAADCTSAAPEGMVLIPAGTFWMGCNAANTSCSPNANESPQHKVTLSAYYMDVTEVTVTQYKACVDAGGCTVPSTQSPAAYATYPGFANNPVNFVNWTQAQTYCQWRGAGYDLPSEAQWEMAARGSCEKNGSTAGDPACAAAMRTYPWGEAASTCAYVVMAEGTGPGCGTGGTWAVGSKTAGGSPYGLLDMSGNLWEWTRDFYSATYYGISPESDPINTTSTSFRVRRSSRFDNYDGLSARVAARFGVGPATSGLGYGFRCMKPYP